MQIYNYDSITGEFLTPGIADESPLEPGKYLIPAFATDQEPPIIGKNQIAIYREGTWQIVPDYRGQEAYDIDENGFCVGSHDWQIGDEPGKTVVLTQNPVVPKPKWNGTQWINGRTQEEKIDAIRVVRDSLISESDWLMLPDVPITAENRIQWQVYRQALRDFTATCDVDNPIWPIQPEYITA